MSHEFGWVESRLFTPQRILDHSVHAFVLFLCECFLQNADTIACYIAKIFPLRSVTSSSSQNTHPVTEIKHDIIPTASHGGTESFTRSAILSCGIDRSVSIVLCIEPTLLTHWTTLETSISRSKALALTYNYSYLVR